MSIRDQDFLRFARKKMQDEAQERDATRVTLRIEGHALIVSEQRPTETRATVERHNHCLLD